MENNEKEKKLTSRRMMMITLELLLRILSSSMTETIFENNESIDFSRAETQFFSERENLTHANYGDKK